MRNRIFALTLALMFIAAALGVALSVTLRNRANDGAEKAQALRAQAEDLETNGETGIWAIDAEKQKVYEKQDALAVEIKDLERQIKDDEDSIARDKQNIDELAGLYDQLDAAVLRTEVWQAAAEIPNLEKHRAEIREKASKTADAKAAQRAAAPSMFRGTFRGISAAKKDAKARLEEAETAEGLAREELDALLESLTGGEQP